MMDRVNKDVKGAVCEAEKFFSVTLAQEKLSPAAEKERSLLADKFRKLKTQLGLQNDLPGGGKTPPRPPKGGIRIPAPVPNEDQGGEELYDDVAAVIPQDEYYEMSQGVEGNQEQGQAATDTTGENYEVMSGESTNEVQGGEPAGEDYMAMEDDGQVQEDYEEPQQENAADEDYEIAEHDKKPPAPATQEESYEVPGADSDYEEADHSASKDTTPVDSDMYEGVESPGGMGDSSVDGINTVTKQRSESVTWDHLTKNTSPDNIEGCILKGFLNKRRKEGKIYVGSRYQKRFCVVRNHVMYYFRDKRASKQQGHILLPGYKAQLANKRGREFILTHAGDGQRTYQFESNSKEETAKWMKAIQAACDAPMSERQGADLDEMRNKQPSGDEDSLHYADAGQTKNESVEEEEVYDDTQDTQEELYEEVGSIQPSVSNQPPPSPIQEVDYEISASAGVPSKQAPLPPSPAETKTVEPIQEEEYELPEASPPPPRPSKTQPVPPIPSEDKPPEVPPPRPSKGQPPPPPTPQQDDYEIAGPDAPGDTSDLPPPPPPAIEEENYEVPEEPPAPPPTRPPKKPQPQTPQSPVAPPADPPAEKIPERQSKPAVKEPPRPPKRKDESPPQSPTEINYANVYQALWNCDADDNDELGFRRGDLIYIYEKPHNDWWIGSLYKPQGYSVGLVPRKYVMEAYEFSAA